MKKTTILIFLGILFSITSVVAQGYPDYGYSDLRVVKAELEYYQANGWLDFDSLKVISVYGNKRYLCAKTIQDTIYYEVAFELSISNKKEYIIFQQCRDSNKFDFDVLHSIIGCCNSGGHTTIPFDLGTTKVFEYYKKK